LCCCLSMKGLLSSVQQKLGGHSQASNAAAAHKIVDKDFDKEKENLRTLIGEGQDIIKALKTQNRNIRSWLVDPLKDIDAGLMSIYGEDHRAYLAFQKVYVNIQSANIVFEQEQTDAIAKMNEYLNAASELKKSVAQRDAKVNEVDRACVQVFQLQGGRDVSKAQTAMTRYKNLKDEYEKLNAEVLFQLRSFMHQRQERFDAHFKEAMTSWNRFFETGATLFASLDSPDGANAHPPLPTPPAHSAQPPLPAPPAQPLPTPPAQSSQPPLPPKPTVDLLSGDVSSDAPIAEPAVEPTPAPAEPAPSTAKSRVEKFGVRMLPVAPNRSGESQPAASEPAADPAPSTDAPPPIPPKPKSPDAI